MTNDSDRLKMSRVCRWALCGGALAAMVACSGKQEGPSPYEGRVLEIDQTVSLPPPPPPPPPTPAAPLTYPTGRFERDAPRVAVAAASSAEAATVGREICTEWTTERLIGRSVATPEQRAFALDWFAPLAAQARVTLHTLRTRDPAFGALLDATARAASQRGADYVTPEDLVIFGAARAMQQRACHASSVDITADLAVWATSLEAVYATVVELASTNWSSATDPERFWATQQAAEAVVRRGIGEAGSAGDLAYREPVWSASSAPHRLRASDGEIRTSRAVYGDSVVASGGWVQPVVSLRRAAATSLISENIRFASSSDCVIAPPLARVFSEIEPGDRTSVALSPVFVTDRCDGEVFVRFDIESATSEDNVAIELRWEATDGFASVSRVSVDADRYGFSASGSSGRTTAVELHPHVRLDQSAEVEVTLTGEASGVYGFDIAEGRVGVITVPERDAGASDDLDVLITGPSGNTGARSGFAEDGRPWALLSLQISPSRVPWRLVTESMRASDWMLVYALANDGAFSAASLTSRLDGLDRTARVAIVERLAEAEIVSSSQARTWSERFLADTLDDDDSNRLARLALVDLARERSPELAETLWGLPGFAGQSRGALLVDGAEWVALAQLDELTGGEHDYTVATLEAALSGIRGESRREVVERVVPLDLVP